MKCIGPAQSINGCLTSTISIKIKFARLDNPTMEKSLITLVFILGILFVPSVFHNSYSENATKGVKTFHSDVDVSPIEGIIMINEDQNKTVFFQPNTLTVRVGGEILIANNSTSDHSVTSGLGPNDPMSGKLFNTEFIKPKGFVEYIPQNLSPGNYSFYSSTDPKIKGQLVVTPLN